MLDRLSFVLAEAAVAMRRNVAMAFATVTTGAVALFLLGSLAFAYKLASDYSRTLPAMFDMRVFLRDSVKFADVKATADRIRMIPGVASVVWIPRDKAWALMQRQQPALTRDLANPLPDQFKVVLKDIHAGEPVATQVQALPTVAEDGVRYLRHEEKIAIAILDCFRMVGPAVVTLLLVATGILIYNTIRLTVLSRRVEIRIMQLVGASGFAVRAPFVIEGLVQGLIAGSCAGLLLLAAESILRDRLTQESLTFAEFPATQAIWLLAALGAGYGVLCSLVAVRAPLRAR